MAVVLVRRLVLVIIIALALVVGSGWWVVGSEYKGMVRTFLISIDPKETTPLPS